MEQKKNSDQRDYMLDVLKGMAIFLVVLGHAIQSTYGDDMDSNILFRIIYSFHMPLFIFLSGYTYGKYGKSFHFTWLKRRFCQLIIPFYVWILIFWLLRDWYCTDFSLQTRYLNAIKNPSDNGLWFLMTIFYNCVILCVTYYVSCIVYRIRNIQKIRYELVELIVYCVIWFGLFILMKHGKINLPFRLGIWYDHFFLLGYIIPRLAILFPIRLKGKAWIRLFSMLVFAVLVSEWNRLMDVTWLFKGEIGWVQNQLYTIYRYGVPITAIVGIFQCAEWICSINILKKVKQHLIALGKNTMPIYAMQWFFLSLDVGNNCVRIVLLTMTGIVMPLFVYHYVIKKIGILNALCFGGRS